MPTELSDKLAGKTAIITGAGAGIGRGMAVRMAKEGANVVLVGRTLEPLKESAAAAGGRAICVQGSTADKVTAERAVAEAVSAFGSVDVLVNNAHSFTPNLSMEETPEEDLRTHMESGFFGTWHFMQAAFPHMRERGGSIINFGSIAGVNGWGTFTPYAAAKEAIRGMSRSAARDWGRYKIRVNVIVPSSHSKYADEWLTEERMQGVVAMIPLGYLGNPDDDIAPVAVFLASDDSRYVTGRTIHVDGGML